MLQTQIVYKSENAVVRVQDFRGNEWIEMHESFCSRSAYKSTLHPKEKYTKLDVVVRRNTSKAELHTVINKAKQIAIDLSLERHQKSLMSLLLMYKSSDIFDINMLVGLDGSVGDFLRLQEYGDFDMVLFNNFGYDNRGVKTLKQDIIDSLRSITKILAPNISRMYEFEAVALDCDESIQRFISNGNTLLLFDILELAETNIGGLSIGSVLQKANIQAQKYIEMYQS